MGELSKVCSQIVLKCLHLARSGRPDILWSVNKLARSITKWTKGLWQNAWIDWFHIFIVHVNTNSIVMWETLPNNADWNCFKTLILQEILRIQNQLLEEHCAFLEVIRLFQSVGCVTNKLEFRRVQQNQKSFPWTQDWGWTENPHLIYGIWSSQFFTETRVRVIKHGETCARTYVRFVQHLTHFKNERNLMEWLMIWTMILSPQTSNLLILLYVFEDNEAVIKMIFKGRSPTMRHVSRTHRVVLD